MQAYLLAQTIKNGWRRTLPAAFAPLISDGPIVLLVLFVLTQTPAWFVNGLRIAGGFFLLYLAWAAYKNTAVDQPLQPDLESAQRGVFKAALINALSPNPYIFWATIAGPIFLEGWAQSSWHGFSFIFGFYITLIGGFMSFVALFSVTHRLDPKINRLLNGLAAIALAGFGLFQLWKGISEII